MMRPRAKKRMLSREAWQDSSSATCCLSQVKKKDPTKASQDKAQLLCAHLHTFLGLLFLLDGRAGKRTRFISLIRMLWSERNVTVDTASGDAIYIPFIVWMALAGTTRGRRRRSKSRQAGRNRPTRTRCSRPSSRSTRTRTRASSATTSAALRAPNAPASSTTPRCPPRFDCSSPPHLHQFNCRSFNWLLLSSLLSIDQLIILIIN